MTGVSSPSSLIPEARDNDDDDVAWALQTAAVQWKRGGRVEAVSWLRRAAEAAVEAGAYARARELNTAAVSLEHASRLVGDRDGEDFDGAEPILEIGEEAIVEEVEEDEPDEGRPELPNSSGEGDGPAVSRPVPRVAPPPMRALRPPPKAGAPPMRRTSGQIRPFDEGLPPVFPPVVSRGSSSLPSSPGVSNRAQSEGFDLPDAGLRDFGLPRSGLLPLGARPELGLPEIPPPPSVRGIPPLRPSVPEPPYERAASPAPSLRARAALPLPPVPLPPDLSRGPSLSDSRPQPPLMADIMDEPPAESEPTTGSGHGRRRAVWSFAPEMDSPAPPSEPPSRPPTHSRPTWSFAPAESGPPEAPRQSLGPSRAEPDWTSSNGDDDAAEPPPESFPGSVLPAAASESFAPSDSVPPQPSDALNRPAPEVLQRESVPYRQKAPSAEELDLADAEELPIVDTELVDAEPSDRAMLADGATPTPSDASGLNPFEPEPLPPSFGESPAVPRESAMGAQGIDAPGASGAPTLVAASSSSPERRSPELRAMLLCPRVPTADERQPAPPSASALASGLNQPEQSPPASASPDSMDAPAISTHRGVPESRVHPLVPESAAAERTARSWPVSTGPLSEPEVEPADSDLRPASLRGGATASCAPLPDWSDAPTAAGIRRALSQQPLQAVDPSVGGIRLADVRGLQDLPEDAQRRLVASARVQELAAGEEVGPFSVALVTRGWFRIMPAVTDTVCARAKAGDVVFTAGTIEGGLDLCVRAGEDASTVAVWGRASLDQATADCPWVADELRLVADGLQALAGVSMGRLGDRLDESLRSMVTDRCDVRTLRPGEIVAEEGQRLPGMHIVGAGRLELVAQDGTVEAEVGPGEFLFASQVLTAGMAPKTARAGKQGALVLVAERKVTHELVTSVPPLLELLAEE